MNITVVFDGKVRKLEERLCLVKNEEKQIVEGIVKSGKQIYKRNKSGLCNACFRSSGYHIHRQPRKMSSRPCHNDLLNDMKGLGYKGTGRKHGVSDTTIRKWIKAK